MRHSRSAALETSVAVIKQDSSPSGLYSYGKAFNYGFMRSSISAWHRSSATAACAVARQEASGSSWAPSCNSTHRFLPNTGSVRGSSLTPRGCRAVRRVTHVTFFISSRKTAQAYSAFRSRCLDKLARARKAQGSSAKGNKQPTGDENCTCHVQGVI